MSQPINPADFRIFVRIKGSFTEFRENRDYQFKEFDSGLNLQEYFDSFEYFPYLEIPKGKNFQLPFGPLLKLGKYFDALLIPVSQIHGKFYDANGEKKLKYDDLPHGTLLTETETVNGLLQGLNMNAEEVIKHIFDRPSVKRKKTLVIHLGDRDFIEEEEKAYVDYLNRQQDRSGEYLELEPISNPDPKNSGGEKEESIDRVRIGAHHGEDKFGNGTRSLTAERLGDRVAQELSKRGIRKVGRLRLHACDVTAIDVRTIYNKLKAANIVVESIKASPVSVDYGTGRTRVHMAGPNGSIVVLKGEAQVDYYYPDPQRPMELIKDSRKLLINGDKIFESPFSDSPILVYKPSSELIVKMLKKYSFFLSNDLGISLEDYKKYKGRLDFNIFKDNAVNDNVDIRLHLPNDPNEPGITVLLGTNRHTQGDQPPFVRIKKGSSIPSDCLVATSPLLGGSIIVIDDDNKYYRVYHDARVMASRFYDSEKIVAKVELDDYLVKDNTSDKMGIATVFVTQDPESNILPISTYVKKGVISESAKQEYLISGSLNLSEVKIESTEDGHSTSHPSPSEFFKEYSLKIMKDYVKAVLSLDLNEQSKQVLEKLRLQIEEYEKSGSSIKEETWGSLKKTLDIELNNRLQLLDARLRLLNQGLKRNGRPKEPEKIQELQNEHKKYFEFALQSAHLNDVLIDAKISSADSGIEAFDAPLVAEFRETGKSESLKVRNAVDNFEIWKELKESLEGNPELEGKEWIPSFEDLKEEERKVYLRIVEKDNPESFKYIEVKNGELLKEVIGRMNEELIRDKIDNPAKANNGEESAPDGESADLMSVGMSVQTLMNLIKKNEQSSKGVNGNLNLYIALKIHSYINMAQLGQGVILDAAKIINLVKMGIQAEREVSAFYKSFMKVFGEGVGTGLMAVTFGLDIYEAIEAKDEDQKIVFGTQAGFDGASLLMNIGSLSTGMAAEAAGEVLAAELATASSFLGGIGTVLGGLGIGFAALAQAFNKINDDAKRIYSHFQDLYDGFEAVEILHGGYQSYKLSDLSIQGPAAAPEHSIAHGKSVVTPRAGLAIVKLDFTTNQLTYGSQKIWKTIKDGTFPGTTSDETYEIRDAFNLTMGKNFKAQVPIFNESYDATKFETIILPADPNVSIDYYWTILPFAKLRLHHKRGWHLVQGMTHHIHFKNYFYSWPSEYILSDLYPHYEETTIEVYMNSISRVWVMQDLSADHLKGLINYKFFASAEGGGQTIILKEGAKSIQLYCHNQPGEGKEIKWRLDAQGLDKLSADKMVVNAPVKDENQNLFVQTVTLGTLQVQVLFVEGYPASTVTVTAQNDKNESYMLEIPYANPKDLKIKGIEGVIEKDPSVDKLHEYLRSLAANKKLGGNLVPIYDFKYEYAAKQYSTLAWYDVPDDRIIYTESTQTDLTSASQLVGLIHKSAFFWNVDEKMLWQTDLESHKPIYKYKLLFCGKDLDLVNILSMIVGIKAVQRIRSSDSAEDVTIHYDLMRDRSRVVELEVKNWDLDGTKQYLNDDLSTILESKFSDKIPVSSSFEHLEAEIAKIEFAPMIMVSNKVDANADEIQRYWVRTYKEDKDTKKQVELIQFNWEEDKVDDAMLVNYYSHEDGDVYYFYSKSSDSIYEQKGTGTGSFVSQKANRLPIDKVTNIQEENGTCLVTSDDGFAYHLTPDGVLSLAGIGKKWLEKNKTVFWDQLFELVTFADKADPVIFISGLKDSNQKPVKGWFDTQNLNFILEPIRPKEVTGSFIKESAWEFVGSSKTTGKVWFVGEQSRKLMSYDIPMNIVWQLAFDENMCLRPGAILPEPVEPHAYSPANPYSDSFFSVLFDRYQSANVINNQCYAFSDEGVQFNMVENIAYPVSFDMHGDFYIWMMTQNFHPFTMLDNEGQERKRLEKRLNAFFMSEKSMDKEFRIPFRVILFTDSTSGNAEVKAWFCFKEGGNEGVYIEKNDLIELKNYNDLRLIRSYGPRRFYFLNGDEDKLVSYDLLPEYSIQTPVEIAYNSCEIIDSTCYLCPKASEEEINIFGLDHVDSFYLINRSKKQQVQIEPEIWKWYKLIVIDLDEKCDSFLLDLQTIFAYGLKVYKKEKDLVFLDTISDRSLIIKNVDRKFDSFQLKIFNEIKALEDILGLCSGDGLEQTLDNIFTSKIPRAYKISKIPDEYVSSPKQGVTFKVNFGVNNVEYLGGTVYLCYDKEGKIPVTDLIGEFECYSEWLEPFFDRDKRIFKNESRFAINQNGNNNNITRIMSMGEHNLKFNFSRSKEDEIYVVILPKYFFSYGIPTEIQSWSY